MPTQVMGVSLMFRSPGYATQVRYYPTWADRQGLNSVRQCWLGYLELTERSSHGHTAPSSRSTASEAAASAALMLHWKRHPAEPWLCDP